MTAYKAGSMKVFLFIYLRFMCICVRLHVYMFTAFREARRGHHITQN